MATFAKAGTLYNIGLQELGEAILQDAFRTAAKSFLATTNAWEVEAIPSALAFVKGSGLETIIQQFALPLDAQVLRETFQWKLTHSRGLAWSSAIIKDATSFSGA